MTKDQLIDVLIANHNHCAAIICSLPDEHFKYKHNGKWDAGQQLAHLILCLKPISQALSSPEVIRKRFGTLNRIGMDYHQLIAFYKTGLSNGGKAPERFLPPAIDVDHKDELRGELEALLSAIQAQLGGYSEDDLDLLALPHPFLGLLSIRELFYLMSYHPLHHLEQVKNNINAIID